MLKHYGKPQVTLIQTFANYLSGEETIFFFFKYNTYMLCMKINNFFYNSEVVLWLLSMGKKASSMQRKTKFPGILNTFFLYNNENKGNFSQQNTQKIAQIIIQDLEWMRVPPQAIYIHATIFLHITSGINKQKPVKSHIFIIITGSCVKHTENLIMQKVHALESINVLCFWLCNYKAWTTGILIWSNLIILVHIHSVYNRLSCEFSTQNKYVCL